MEKTEEYMVTVQVPVGLVKLLRRLSALENGRVLVAITKEKGEVVDWSFLGEGKVERPGQGTG